MPDSRLIDALLDRLELELAECEAELNYLIGAEIAQHLGLLTSRHTEPLTPRAMRH